MHVASHAHEFEQSMPLLHPEVSQFAVQMPVPHWIPGPHPALFVQLALQSIDPLQSMPLAHAPLAVHSTVQSAAEHVTAEPQMFDAVHWIRHSSPLQLTPELHVFDAVHWRSQRPALQAIGAALQSPLWLHRSLQSTPVGGHSHTGPQSMSQ
jgi:hypothetical protein